MPVIEILTDGNQIPNNPKINAQLNILVENQLTFDSNIAIETNGLGFKEDPKKSYSFETRNASNEDINVSLLGLPVEEDWVLEGPYSDKTLLRNKLIYDLSRSIGNYASRSVFVEVDINNEYQGVYTLLEKLKRDDNRIDISKLNPDENSGEDLTGGYILIIDDAEEDSTEYFNSGYSPPSSSNQSISFNYEEPGADEITIQQKNYIQNYVSGFEDALKSQNFTDPVSGYISYIDVSSFIDFFLLNELANNVDAYRKNSYITKDKNGKLNMGPVWSFSSSLGNVDFCSAGETNVWAYKFNERCGDFDELVPFWWSRFLEDPAFVSQLKERWSKLRSDEFSESSLTEMIDSYSELLQNSRAVDRNFEKWNILSTDVHPNNFVGDTYQEEITYLKQWLSDRLNWLDTQISNL